MKIKVLIGIYLILLLASCDSGPLYSGYQKENDKWVWVTWDKFNGNVSHQLGEHDVESFKIMGTLEYAKDKNSVFYEGSRIDGADPNSFKVISKTLYGTIGYSKDKYYVFLNTEKVIFANPYKFELLEYPYSTDDDNIFCGILPLMIYTAEVDEFKVTQKGFSYSSYRDLSEFIEENPKYKWLSSLNIKEIPVYGEYATGETKNRKFEGFKEIKEWKYTIWVGSPTFGVASKTDTFNIDNGIMKYVDSYGIEKMYPIDSIYEIKKN